MQTEHFIVHEIAVMQTAKEEQQKREQRLGK